MKHLSTRLAKKTALMDIAKEEPLNKQLRYLLMMSTETQLKNLPCECRVSIDTIDIDNCKRVSDIKRSFVFEEPPQKKIKVNVHFKDILLHDYEGYTKGQRTEYFGKITRSCLHFIKSFNLKIHEYSYEFFNENLEVIKNIDINAKDIIKHKRFVSINYLQSHTKDAIEEYNQLMVWVANLCNKYYKNFDVNDYEK